MTLDIRDRSAGDRARAVQLINKTNQFNLNGRRIDDHEVATLLAQGSKLLTATLTDRTGSHGEILAALIDPNGRITSMVMSCRVFQRRVEFAFLAWVAGRWPHLKSAVYIPTDRNTPVGRFVSELGTPIAEDGTVTLNSATLVEQGARDVALFTIHFEASVA